MKTLIVAAFGVAVAITVAGAMNYETDPLTIKGIDSSSAKSALLIGIEIEGQIREDTGNRVLDAWKEAIEDGQSVAYFRLNSTGGDVNGAIMLAKALSWDTGNRIPILIDVQCYSACAIAALLAGPRRIVLGKGANIGLHQVYDMRTSRPLPDVTGQLTTALRKAGVPESALKRMRSTKPSDISFLNQNELMAMSVQGRYVVPKR